MRQVKIKYENFEREENKAMVAEIILAYAWLFPVWLKTLTVCIYDKHPDGDKWSAWSDGAPEYGTATIEMMAPCLDKPERWFRELMVHELIHIAHMRVYDLMRGRLTLRFKEDNPELYEFLEEDMRQRVEEFCENAALGIVGALLPEPVQIEETRHGFLNETTNSADDRIVPIGGKQ